MSIQMKFKEYNCSVQFGKYPNGRTSITLTDEEGPVAVATINVPEIEIPNGDVIIKNYSENEGILEALIAEKIVSPSKERINLGYVKADRCTLLKGPE